MLVATRKVVAVEPYERFFIPLQEAYNHNCFNYNSAVNLGIRSKVLHHKYYMAVRLVDP